MATPMLPLNIILNCLEIEIANWKCKISLGGYDQCMPLHQTKCEVENTWLHIKYTHHQFMLVTHAFMHDALANN